MSVTGTDEARVRTTLRAVAPDEPLTAREVLALLDANGEAFGTAHRVATVLGRWADASDEVEVITDQPYRYRFRFD